MTPSDDDVSKLFGTLTKPPKKETEIEKRLREIKEINERLKRK